MKHRIVVLGAGYAGAYVAGNLARRLAPADTGITVVNAVPDLVQRLRLHQLAAGRDLQAPQLADVFAGTGIRLRPARVTALDPPLLDGDPMLGPADTFEQRDPVSPAVLTLMERLSPVERAVYVLREAFSHSHAEIAEILGITESASQQRLHRARRRITAARCGGDVDPASARRIVEEFLAAASSGRTDRLVALLTDDATAITDGAGLTGTLLRYDTPRRVAAVAQTGFNPAATRRFAGDVPAGHFAIVNRSPALVF